MQKERKTQMKISKLRSLKMRTSRMKSLKKKKKIVMKSQHPKVSSRQEPTMAKILPKTMVVFSAATQMVTYCRVKKMEINRNSFCEVSLQMILKEIQHGHQELTSESIRQMTSMNSNC